MHIALLNIERYNQRVFIKQHLHHNMHLSHYKQAVNISHIKYAREVQLSSAGAAARMLTYIRIRQHTSAYVSIRQHTSAYVSIPLSSVGAAAFASWCCNLSVYPPPVFVGELNIIEKFA